MCGIAGAVWNHADAAVSDEILVEMCAQLVHRGPDGAGRFRSEIQPRPPYATIPGVALGHRRLAILDRAGGAQPISNETGSVTIVFNGEIYNHASLRRRLEGAGHTFRTQSDTETIVHLYEDLGAAAFSHLNGMFAAAIWDREKGSLFLVRDRFGKKPLYYAVNEHRLVFASEPRAIMATRLVSAEIDRSAIDAYLTYQYIPHPLTAWREIRKLPPHTYAEYREGRLTIAPYESAQPKESPITSFASATTELQTRLAQSVELRRMSEVPLGAFLSGGIDSSLTTALLQKGSTERVKTFTIGFEEREYDERPFAQAVAKQLGTEHFEEVLTPSFLSETLDQIVRTLDEPFADSSAVPTYLLSQLARKHVTVALSGDGGDELFQGYDRYRAVALAQGIDARPWLRSLFTSSIWNMSGSGRRWSGRFQRFRGALRLDPMRRYLDYMSIFSESQRGELYSSSFCESLPAIDPASYFERSSPRVWKGRHAAIAAEIDQAEYLPCDLMTKVDLTGMAHGLEVRHPFLDDSVVSLARSVPYAFHVGLLRGKRLLRAAARELLPSDVLKRRKQGFGIPLAAWFRGPLKSLLEAMLADSPLFADDWFQRETVSRLFEEHLRGSRDHAPRLWSLLVLDRWLRMR